MLIVSEKRHKIKVFFWYYLFCSNLNIFQHKIHPLNRVSQFNFYVDILTALDLWLAQNNIIAINFYLPQIIPTLHNLC